jgi:hypothetical protein
MKSRALWITLTLFVASVLLSTGAASACNQQCQRVPGSTFCKQCVDTENYTGATCQSSGSCACFYTHNTCGLGISGIQAQERTADLAFLADAAPTCEAPPAEAGLQID